MTHYRLSTYTTTNDTYEQGTTCDLCGEILKGESWFQRSHAANWIEPREQRFCLPCGERLALKKSR